MTLLSVKSTPDQEDRSEDVTRAESMNGQPPCLPSVSSSQQEEGADSFSHSARQPEEPVWVDLVGPDRAQLEEVRRTLGFSPEVITHCFLPAHAPKVIPIDSALFLVTFLGARAPAVVGRAGGGAGAESRGDRANASGRKEPHGTGTHGDPDGD